MTTTAVIPPLCEQQHLLFDDVSWESYEQILEAVGNRPIFVTFFRGRMEVMPPLAEHELEKKAIASLVELLTIELKIPMRRFGSTTFRREDAQAGLEPDECYYLQNESKVRSMRRFDPAIHPAPDLAIEIDITHRSISRLPIYASLGVPEVWRYDGHAINVMVLSGKASYQLSAGSPSFPFLPMAAFQQYVDRLLGDEEQNAVIDQFRQWVRQLQR